ncbi:AraC family transcriptional regulator [Saccharibacillus sp. O23]|uniref:helix-turn-helix domain-containing protein n=1 Tax=Saccharibacillus sp. O23 TaxID=2009338 RepID=UPI000B4E0E64|nr:AraC family transcriptional regulator [Saccharibacillus sp. O23]OWR30443.1 AraC family transcriptional regulator [Saccharibacillus sp. O23]
MDRLPGRGEYVSGGLSCLAGGHKPANLHQWGPGVRDVYALHYIVEGFGTFETGGAAYRLGPGDSFVIFPGCEVYYYPDLLDPWEYVWNEFAGEEARRLLALAAFEPEHPVAVATLAAPDLGSLFHTSWSPGVKPFERLRTDAGLRLLLSHYAERYARHEEEATDYVRVAKTYVERNYWNSSLTVQEIAGAAKIERSYLFRLFKEATGRSVSAYIAGVRIERACELLRGGDLSVQSVAYSVGYGDPLHFSKTFKKAVSVSPTAYRALHASPH